MAHRRQRDTFDSSLDPLDGLLSAPQPLSPLPVVEPLTEALPTVPLDDLRRYHPEGDLRSPSDFIGTQATLRPAPLPYRAVLQHMEQGTTPHEARGPLRGHSRRFESPQTVYRCVQRKTRKEVIFAKRKTGKGAKARRHRNHYSNVHC